MISYSILLKGKSLKRVFIASSGDLYNERIKLETLLNREGFKPILWEALEKSITEEEFQKRLNREQLITSDIVIFMVNTKFGKYTQQEFDFSYQRLGKEIEKIYVYFFKEGLFDASDEERKNIDEFRDFLQKKEEKLYIAVKNFQDLKISILEERKYWEQPQKHSFHIEDTQKEIDLQKAVKEFLKEKNDIELLQQTALKFLPKDYRNPIPNSVENILNLLLEYGKTPNCNCVPLLCMLGALYPHYSYEKSIKNYIDYLKDKHQTSNSCNCQENSVASDVHIGIEFFDDSDEKSNGHYSIVLWEYSNNSYQLSSLEYKDSVNIQDKQSIIKLFDYLDNKLNRYKKLYIEIILPLDMYENEILLKNSDFNYKGIREWHIVRGRRKEQICISSVYRLIYRIQDRFRIPFQTTWEESWDNIVMEKSLLFNTLEESGVIKEKKYNPCLSTGDSCVITNNKIENLIDILDHIEIYEISIALIQLSDKIDNKFFKNLVETSIENSKLEITELVKKNYANENSNILFLLDNPNHRPQYATGKNHKYNK